jgi:hypothetical protein
MSGFKPAEIEQDKPRESSESKKPPGLPGLGDHDLKSVQDAGKVKSGSAPLGKIEIIEIHSPPIPGKQRPDQEYTPAERAAIDAKRITDLSGRKNLNNSEKEELDDLLQMREQANDDKLFEKRKAGTISKEDNAWLIGREEFGSHTEKEASKLVSKEVLGTISKDERAALAGWREFREPGQENARSLAKQEALGTLDEKGAAKLAAWREFPPVKFARARDLATREGSGDKLGAEETKELANWREQPRIPVWGRLSVTREDAEPIVAGDKDAGKEQNNFITPNDRRFGRLPEKAEDARQTKRADDIDKLAKEEWPDDAHAQDLVRLYMNGKLSRAQAAELAGLRAYGDDKEARSLVEKERLSTITPSEKAALLARREFPESDPDSLRARNLAAGEVSGSISRTDRSELVARREFSGYAMGEKVEVPAGAIELAKKENLKTINAREAQLLQEARLKYQEAYNKAMDKLTPPPPLSSPSKEPA